MTRAWVLLAVCGLMLYSTGKRQASAESPTTAPTPAPATQPARVKEAKLPEGFPEPGPLGEVVVKEYPAVRAAIVNANDVKVVSPDAMFRPLFNHIEKNHIAMSAPVDITWSTSNPDGNAAEPKAMAFLYPSPKVGQSGKDGVVDVIDEPAMIIVSITIRGDYDANHFNKGLAQLNAWLADHKPEYHPAGPPRYLCYNSPFVPGFLKIGEVQIPITKTK